MSAVSFTPELKASYKNLVKSLVRSSRRSRIQQLEASQKKEIALLKYDLIKLNRLNLQSTDPKNMEKHSDTKKQIERLENSALENSKKLLFHPQISHLKELILTSTPSSDSTKHSNRIKHFKEVSDFLINQSEYDELVERYNPGLTMSQEEKVKRTAQKVGFEIPPERVN
ncbi:hypothetical protein ACO0RG_001227 [Hanseniaspora osmophila]|uniref:ATP synthase assembly factor FMC1, mitochondrial n=1 Tax=Hanseniaspora osmophila TaxID=56408 RepID=A0A1E5RN90_9ASCO|nr:hypothetical protein AWRI3579_g861 [Hanseniaspora osmophila]